MGTPRRAFAGPYNGENLAVTPENTRFTITHLAFSKNYCQISHADNRSSYAVYGIPSLCILCVLRAARQSSSRMVFRLPAVNIQLCTIEVLERRLFAVLDAKPAPKLPHCRPFYHSDSRRRNRTSQTRPATVIKPSKKIAAARICVLQQFDHSACYSCSNLCFYPAASFAHPDSPASCPFHAFYILGGCLASRPSSESCSTMDHLECSLGNHIYHFMGNLPTPSLVPVSIRQKIPCLLDQPTTSRI